MLASYTYPVALLSPVGELVSAIREQLPFVPALIVVMVAVAAVVAVAHSQRPEVRRSFLAAFFAALLVVNLVGLPVLPFMHWHKFSAVQSVERNYFEYQVVAADGTEIRFDERSLTNVDGPSPPLITGQMRAADDAERAELSAYMLERARIHREKVESRSPLHLLRFPPHSVREVTPSEVTGHGEFVGLRTYERTIVISEDGRRLVSDERVLVFEYIDGEATATAAASDAPTPSDVEVGVTAIPQSFVATGVVR